MDNTVMPEFPEIPMEVNFNKESLELNSKLHKKQNKLRKELSDKGILPKGAHNDYDNYDYFSEAQYKELFIGLLAKHGLEFDSSEINIQSIVGTEKQPFGILATMKYIITDIDTGYSTESVHSGLAIDKGDKAIYKAKTGALKSFFASTFLVATKDDPERDDEIDRHAVENAVDVIHLRDHARDADSSRANGGQGVQSPVKEVACGLHGVKAHLGKALGRGLVQSGQVVILGANADGHRVTDADADGAAHDVGGGKPAYGIVVADLGDRTRDDVKHQGGGALVEGLFGKRLGRRTEVGGEKVGQLGKAAKQKADVPEAAERNGHTLAVDQRVERLAGGKVELDAAALGAAAHLGSPVRKGEGAVRAVLNGKAEGERLSPNQVSCSLVQLQKIGDRAKHAKKIAIGQNLFVLHAGKPPSRVV